MSAEPLLSVRGLAVRFPVRGGLLGRGRRIVHAAEAVSFEVGRGQIVGLIGESGSGKTTVGRAIIGLERPSEGDVLFEGLSVLRQDRQARKAYRRRVQFVFQDPFASLDPRMRVAALIAEPLQVHRIGNAADRLARVRSLLDRVGLPQDALPRYPHEFSGGQRQRIGIARALAIEPALVIADEPVSALDVSVAAQIINLLAALRHETGVSLLMVAHDLPTVSHLCDRIVVMFLGHVVEDGPAAAVSRAPRHPYTRALIAATPRLDAAGRSRMGGAARQEGEALSPLDPPSGCVFHPRCPHALPLCALSPPPSFVTGDANARHRTVCHRPELFA